MTAKRVFGLRARIHPSLRWLCAAALAACVVPAFAETLKSELECGGKRLEAFSTCQSAEVGGLNECTRQEIVFGQEPNARRLVFSPPRRARYQTLNFKAWGWVCVQGNDGYYVVVDFYNGGNCRQCERSEIYDLEGRRVTSTWREFEAFSKRKDFPKRLPESLDIQRVRKSADEKKREERIPENAARKKWAFLRATSMLGVSPERDLEVLGAMTDATIVSEPVPQSDSGPPFHRVRISFSEPDRIAWHLIYEHRSRPDGGYAMSLAIGLAQQYACITMADLGAVGAFSDIEMHRTPHVPQGIRKVIYVKGGTRREFSFITECAFLVSVAAPWKP